VTGPSSGEIPARLAVPSELLHDLRTPLGQVIGYAELLVERAQEAGDDGIVPDLQKISAAGYRILALIEHNFTAAPAEDPGAGAPGEPGAPR
jgi:signal transduction histidine kinase